MWRYIEKRLLVTIPVLIGVSILTFSIIHLIPGDPARILLGDMGGGAASGDMSQQSYLNLRKQLGLDKPLVIQYVDYVSNALRGNLGHSYQTNRSVSSSIIAAAPYTLELTVAGLGFAILLGVALGVIASLYRNSWIDSLAMLVSLTGLAMPSFWLGFIFIEIFSFSLGWFPATGSAGIKPLILPAATLGFIAAGTVTRLVRSTMLEVLQEEYVVTARAKGLRGSTVILRHALRNALIPVVTIIGLQFGSLLAGAVIIETVFARQGLGRLIVDAVLSRDYPVIQGTILVTAVAYVLVNLLVDLSYAWLDPRIKYK
jgi:ABC-type dipeptide/oligopeptide/nickel transport system permease component